MNVNLCIPLPQNNTRFSAARINILNEKKIYINITDAWSIVFAIVNVIARPFSLILLHREMVDRGGSINVSTVYPTTTQRSYEDIDHPKQSVPTNSAAGAGQPPNISNIF